jgi:divalent metal cation (Fe/Co/Zn/Cd) transporter
VTVDSVRRLIQAEEAVASPVGIVLTAASLIVMPVLAVAKRRTGRALGSATVMADSVQTVLCTYLSGIVLAGLLVNAALGWSWADPVAALVVAGVAVREGVQAWRGDDDCHH